MHSRFWRTGTTYVLLIAMVFIMVGPVLMLQAGKISHPINWTFATGILACAIGLGIIHAQTTRFTNTDLRRLVEKALGHSARHPLTVASRVSELLDGQAGWTTLDKLGILSSDLDDYGNTYLADGGLLLETQPKGPSPVLIFRDEKGDMHAFRFGRQIMGLAREIDPKATTYFIHDCGLAGPARFEPVA